MVYHVLNRGTGWALRTFDAITNNRGLNAEQLDEIRTSVNRGRPIGPELWLQRTAKRLGLDVTLRGPGRLRTKP